MSRTDGSRAREAVHAKLRCQFLPLFQLVRHGVVLV
jgi:hypothetical protein